MAFSLDRALSSTEGKALPAHPAWNFGGPTSVYAPGATRRKSVISQRESARHGEAYGGKEAIDWVYDCIGLYADPVSTAPLKLQKPDGTPLVKERTKGTPPDHEVGPSDLYELLAKPNPFMLHGELLYLLVIDLLLVGNAYWYKWRSNSEGKPLSLYRLAPSHVKIVPGAHGPESYEYQPPGARDPLKIKLDDVIHFRRPSPHSAYYGMGVIQGAGRAMDLELAITDTMASYFENRADPSLIVQSERRVPRDVFNKLRAQLRARASGSSRAGELLVLEAGLKATPLGANARDALFADLSKMSRDRIMVKFRTSPLLFGLVDESSGANKVSDVRREFDNYALRPFLDRLQRQISDALISAWDLELLIDHRTLLPPEEALKVAGELSAAPAVRVREVRRQYVQFGIPESTGDPEIDEILLNMPGEEADANGKFGADGEGFADKPLGTEAGRPPSPGNTRAFPVDGSSPAGSKTRAAGKALPEITARLAVAALEERAKALLNADGSRATVGNRLQGEQRPNDSFATARKRDLDSISAGIADALSDASTQLERGLLDHVEGKALKTSDLVGRIRSSAAWTAFRRSVAKALEDGAQRAASAGVMQSGLAPEDEIDYEELVKGVVYRPQGLRSVLSTLRERVVKRVKAARDADAERGDYEAAVREVISEWTASQALTIADTEATEAYNEATLTAAEMSGVANVFVTDGDDFDEPCRAANGEVWTISQARERRTEHPRCRRAFLPIGAVA